MSETQPGASPLAHHFDTVEQQKEAISFGMWVFLVTEVMFFGGMFTAYTIYRYSYLVAFSEASRHMDLILGTINTSVLLISSLTVVLAIHAARGDQRKMILRYLLATILLGMIFLGIKMIEYGHKIQEGHLPGSKFHYVSENPTVLAGNVELFFSLYFAMTGFHALHMVIGVGLIAWLAWRAWRGHFSSEYYNPIEIVGLYWHFVDIVWVFLFPLLYLVGNAGDAP